MGFIQDKCCSLVSEWMLRLLSKLRKEDERVDNGILKTGGISVTEKKPLWLSFCYNMVMSCFISWYMWFSTLNKWGNVKTQLTIWLGGDTDGIWGSPWSIAIDAQNSNCVLCELVESLHLVVLSIHLHTLNTNTEYWLHSTNNRIRSNELQNNDSDYLKHHNPLVMELTCSLPDGLSVHSSL